MSKLYKTAYAVFAIVLVLVAVLFLTPIIPFGGHINVKIVKSGSMEPHIKTGSIVAMRPAPAYNVGDVITFKSLGADIPTTHRILTMEEIDGKTMITTKGDANKSADSALITKDAIQGKVLFSIPYAGYVLDFARQPIGFALLIVLPALLIIFDELEKIWKEYRRLRVPKKEKLKEKISFMPLTIPPFVPTPTKGRMIDINHPVSILETRIAENVRQVPILRTVTTHTSRSRIPQSWVLAPCIVLAFSAFMVSMWSYGGTISYFSDVETALANSMGADALDFKATPENGTSFSFVDGVLDNPDGLMTLVAPEVESVPLEYALTVEFATGTMPFCDAIVANATAPFSYSGPLLLLNASPVMFTGSWTLGITLNPGTYLPGDTCVVDLVYKAWNASTLLGSGGYSDEERTRLTFTAPALALPPSAPIGGAGLRFASILFDVPGDTTTPQEATDTPADTASDTPPVDTSVTPLHEDPAPKVEEEHQEKETEQKDAEEETHESNTSQEPEHTESHSEAQGEGDTHEEG